MISNFNHDLFSTRRLPAAVDDLAKQQSTDLATPDPALPLSGNSVRFLDLSNSQGRQHCLGASDRFVGTVHRPVWEHCFGTAQ
jgi:hypothetical protein